MRLKVGIWVKAYVRICANAGAPAMIVRHGDDDAGAVFIKVNRLDGTAQLFGPAPAGLSGTETDRMWVAQSPPGTAEEEIERRLAREREFDSDVWIIEVEDRAGRHFLDAWLARDS
jgi:hypothetical protein